MTPPPLDGGVYVKEKSMLMSLIFIVVVLLYLLPAYALATGVSGAAQQRGAAGIATGGAQNGVYQPGG